MDSHAPRLASPGNDIFGTTIYHESTNTLFGTVGKLPVANDGKYFARCVAQDTCIGPIREEGHPDVLISEDLSGI